MTHLKIIIFGLFNIFYFVQSHIDLEVKYPALDKDLYESVLDPELCEEQLRYISTDNFILRALLLDAGLRLPRGILAFNFEDLGNYHQCLGISQQVEDYEVSGKYCRVNVPFEQDITILQPDLPDITWPEWFPWDQYSFIENFETVKDFRNLVNRYNVLGGGDLKSDENTPSLNLRLAVCIPRPCTTQQALATLYFNVSNIGLKYNDVYCRLPDDKSWVTADSVAVTILSIIGLITLLSTCYDIHHTVINGQDPKEARKVFASFSIYTNTRNFFIYKSSPGTIECLDGIRALAMTWVVIGHTYSTMATIPMYNPLDVAEWSSSTKSLWIQAAPLSVDTFFMLSGLLLVYTTAGKFTGLRLLRNLHLFYLNRLLRLFPLLACGITLQISIFNRVSDGPLWPQLVSPSINNCRTYWWSTLLHIQNYVNSKNMCLPHSWYVAIDTQLHILSPIVLIWVVSGRRKQAWISLTSGVIVALTAASIYIFMNNFNIMTTGTAEERSTFMTYYYVNTLTRAPPFFVGMVFGYILHVWRGKQMTIPKAAVGVLWICAVTASTLAFYSVILDKKADYDNQTLENFKHSYSRSIWVAALGWMILACIHGYSGPLNWFLSLKQWKPLSRLSYAMYILHYPMMFVYIGSIMQPFYFSSGSLAYLFLSHFLCAITVGFVATVVIDAPLTNLIKLALGPGPKRPQKKSLEV